MKAFIGSQPRGRVLLPHVVGGRSLRQFVATSRAAAASDAAFQSQQPEVFPRISERDPYRLLAVDKEAYPEEIIEAKNYLVEQYGAHEPSREAIEMAYESVMMGDRLKLRKKKGMMRINKKTGKMEGDDSGEAPSIGKRIRSLLEPNVPMAVIINKGFIYAILMVWAAVQYKATGGDCTLPLLINMGYCIYSIFDKRQQRNPEGPFAGGTPLWGALGACVLSFAAGAIVAVGMQNLGLYPAHWDGAMVGAVLMMFGNAVAAIFFK